MYNILFLLTNHRVAEKIIPVIQKLANSNKHGIGVLTIGLWSNETPWVGDYDERKFPWLIKKYGQFYSGPGVKFHGDNITKPIIDYKVLDAFDLVIYDDCRPKPEYNIPAFYQECKKRNIPVIGNSHGNEEYFSRNIGIGISCDKVFVLGEKEKQQLEKLYPDLKGKLLLGGIPANDSLKHLTTYGKTHPDNYLLIITNFLGNRYSPFKVNFDEQFVKEYKIKEQLEELEISKIIVKQKTRLDQPDWERDVEYIQTILPGCEVVTNTDNIDQLILNAKHTISANSTLAFKSIQLYKYPELIKGSGQIGNFYDYDPSALVLSYTYGMPQWIEHTIYGGRDFTSGIKYIEQIENILNYHHERH